MAVEIKVPDMGESVIEATVARWMKQTGDPVSAGEPVVELETDKINLEVGAQQAGVLGQIVKDVGATVAVGDVLATVDPAGGDGNGGGSKASAGEQGDTAPPGAAPGNVQPADTAQVTGEDRAQRGGSTTETADRFAAPQQGTNAVPASVSPVAARMAQEMGIDITQVKPSSGGRITKEDVAAYAGEGQKDAGKTPEAGSQVRREDEQVQAAQAANAPAEASPAPYQSSPAPAKAAPTQPQTVPASSGRETGRETRQRMTRRRQTIAKRLVEAQQTAAMLTTFNEIDMSKVMELRKRRRDGFKERYGIDLGFMSFFTKAVIGALRAFPQINAEIANDEIVLKHYYDIGIAIGAEEGLVVPVIRDADRMSFAEIEKAIREYANKTKEGTLTLDDLRGGTFTITNGGVFGSLLSTPILNPPQVGILGMHKIQERPVIVDGQIVARPMMYVALSYDHRIVDGREAVQFLVRIKELLEDPETLLFS